MLHKAVRTVNVQAAWAANEVADGKLGSGAGELTFAQVAAALKKKGASVEGTGNAIGWASRDESGHLSPYKFTRRAPGPDDIAIQIAYAGICHSDLHQIKNEWGGSQFPMVPGSAPLHNPSRSLCCQ